MNDSAPKFVVIGESVVYQRMQNEAVILDTTGQRFFGLNEAGASIWQALLDHRGDVEAVLGDLKKTYAADETTLRHDLNALVNELLAVGLLKTVGL